MTAKKKKFGVILKKYRLLNKLTQDELAVRIHKTPGTIAQYERGDIFPTFEAFGAIIETLNIDANLFFNNKLNKVSEESKWIAEILDEMSEDEKDLIGRFMHEVSLFLRTDVDKK